MSETVSSASDDRTVNNAVRHQYRVLSDAEKAAMQRVKDLGAELISVCHSLASGGVVRHENPNHRDLSLAIQHAEDAVMRAVRHITA